MAFDSLMAMHVIDEQRYTRYRAAMTPLLHELGGSFRYDFRVAETLRSEAAHPITRVFVISFPDQASSDAFFGDARYLTIRDQHFEGSVAAYTRIGAVHDDSRGGL